MPLVPFRYLENWLSLFYRGRAKTETRSISEPFEVQTKVGEIQTSTNDSLSNAFGSISISWKLAKFVYSGHAKTETRCISEPFEVQTKVGEVQTGTNDSLSNAVSPISIFLKLAKFAI